MHGTVFTEYFGTWYVKGYSTQINIYGNTSTPVQYGTLHILYGFSENTVHTTGYLQQSMYTV